MTPMAWPLAAVALVFSSLLWWCEADIAAKELPAGKSATPVPVVIWHGMGDNCCSPWSMGYIKEFIEKHVPEVYVHSLEIGASVVEDTENGFFMDVNEQVEVACQKIRNDTRLSGG